MKTLLCFFLALVVTTSLRATDPAADPFAVGTVWKGKRQFENNRGKIKKKMAQEWSLKITERTGEHFKGVITLGSSLGGDKFTVDVEGEAPGSGDGDVRFKSEEKGDFRQSFFGKIRNGAIALDFKGKSMGGESTEGVAALSRKE